MLSIKDKRKCSGCGACINACPKKCITFKMDDEGFDYPQIDTSKCINCNLCTKVCPYNNFFINNDILRQPVCFFARTTNKDILNTSSSGGIFYELAAQVLKNGGCVYGASWGNDSPVHVKHIKISKIEDLPLLQGSKYAPSKNIDCFKDAKESLEDNKIVLYSGTPCQIAGLLSFLGEKEYSNLITCDLVCHGMPSPDVTMRFLKEIEHKRGKRVNKFFRDKRNGWKPGIYTLIFEDGSSEVISSEENLFGPLFSYHLADLRLSCYECKFARNPRMADISLGDYFVMENALDLKGNQVVPEDNSGYSLIAVNTKTGLELFNQIKGNLLNVQLQYHTIKTWTLFSSPGNGGSYNLRNFFFYLYKKDYSISKIYDIIFGNHKLKHKFYALGYRLKNKYGSKG